MLVVLLLAVFCVCGFGNEPVVVRWRETRAAAWITQPPEASPFFALDSQLSIPRPLAGSERREIEFSIGKIGSRVESPFILIYEPATLQLIKSLDFEIVYAGKQLISVRHTATYERLTEQPNRVFVQITFRWREKGIDSWLGSLVWTAWIMGWAVMIGAVVSIDEYMRNRVKKKRLN